jgi:hypothetical protein
VNSHEKIIALSKRTLCKMQSFKNTVTSADVTGCHAALRVASDKKTFLGVYINALSPCRVVSVDLEGISIFDEKTQTRIRYDEMTSFFVPGEKTLAKTIQIELMSGEKAFVDILGGKEPFRDVYAFMRFLMRASNFAKQTA